MIQGYFQGQKVNLKVKFARIFLANTKRNKTCVIRHFIVLLTGENVYGIILMIARPMKEYIGKLILHKFIQ